MKPNLFDFATSELSQDAFISWLLSWADPKCAELDPALHELGVAFIAKLLSICSEPIPKTITSVSVLTQYKKIDILATVNENIKILIEDKTATGDHSDQLRRYLETVKTDFPHHAVAPVYLKTGDQCSYSSIEGAGYSCFLRKDFLELLEVSRRAIKNPIYSDFIAYLARIEKRVMAYRELPIPKWHDPDCWKGFFTELRTHLGEESVWRYVANPSGGFMGYWWHRKGNKYLQLEEERLCFKIEVEDKAQQAAAWESWSQTLMSRMPNSPLKLMRPKHRKNGTWMTVALLDGDYRQRNEKGMLDMDKTIEVLRSAEALLDDAVGTARE